MADNQQIVSEQLEPKPSAPSGEIQEEPAAGNQVASAPEPAATEERPVGESTGAPAGAAPEIVTAPPPAQDKQHEPQTMAGSFRNSLCIATVILLLLAIVVIVLASVIDYDQSPPA